MDIQFLDEETKWETYSRVLTTFLSSTDNASVIQAMIANQKTRFPINLDEIRKIDPSLCHSIISNPIKAIKTLQPALQSIIDDLRFGANSQDKKKSFGNFVHKEPPYRITFEGNLGRNLVTPRGLTSQMVNNLVGVQGIITRISLVRPKLVKSMHYCEATKAFTVKEYNDDYELSNEKNVGSTNTFPLKDQAGNPLTCEFGYSTFRDLQTIVVQEMPEKAPTGLLPRSVEVVLEDDLADVVKPGDRVQVVGVYKSIATGQTRMNGYFRVALIATSVSVLATEEITPALTAEDLKHIRKIAERKDLFDLLSKSVAPSIQGHDYIKKGILLMLIGGVEKVLENHTHLRGDINILVIGDPSTAKSQLLRHVLNIAPLAINTTGRGSSGVGLTAAVAFDKETGEKHLEAGAMVLADRGIVCIDEFDKMNEVDRVAIHEVMEQQTVTIAKAGIHTSLNARCSVIAAANPIYGEYQKDMPPTKNIGLPDSLLSRFDLLYVVLDEKSSMHDRKVAERVTKNHRYITSSQAENFNFLNNDDNYVIEPEFIEEKTDQIFEKFNHVLHSSNQKELITQSFLKKYIFFAKKSNPAPSLEDEAIEYIAEAWNKLRQKDLENSHNNGVKNLPITIRTLETLIRLASAHAKLRLSKKIEHIDSYIAVMLLNYALFNEIPEEEHEIEEKNEEETIELVKTGDKAKLRGHKLETPKKMEYIEEEPKQRSIRKLKESDKKPLQQAKTKTENIFDSGKKEDLKESSKKIAKKLKKVKIDEEEDITKTIENNILGSISISEQQIKNTFKMITTLFLEGRKDLTSLDELFKYMKDKNHPLLTREELMKCLIELDSKNKIMYERKTNQVYSLH